MPKEPPEEAGGNWDSYLKGTTYRVYRHMLRQRKPIGISDIQRGLGLSSPSVAEYHIEKLLRMGLIREGEGGYVIDKVVFENIIRIRRISIPKQTAYALFFGVTLLIMVDFLRPTRARARPMVDMHTPTFPVTFAYASAMNEPAPSCLTRTFLGDPAFLNAS